MGGNLLQLSVQLKTRQQPSSDMSTSMSKRTTMKAEVRVQQCVM
jgi:hypothetical protein